jgi:hypothetical protein
MIVVLCCLTSHCVKRTIEEREVLMEDEENVEINSILHEQQTSKRAEKVRKKKKAMKAKKKKEKRFVSSLNILTTS